MAELGSSYTDMPTPHQGLLEENWIRVSAYAVRLDYWDGEGELRTAYLRSFRDIEFHLQPDGDALRNIFGEKRVPAYTAAEEYAQSLVEQGYVRVHLVGDTGRPSYLPSSRWDALRVVHTGKSYFVLDEEFDPEAMTE